MIRHVPLTVLSAAGSDLDVLWISHQPTIRGERDLRHWTALVKQLEENVDRTERLGLQYHNELEMNDRSHARTGEACLDSFTVATMLIGRGLVPPRLFEVVWALTKSGAEAWWLRSGWQMPTNFLIVANSLSDPVRELELFWPYASEFELGMPA